MRHRVLVGLWATLHLVACAADRPSGGAKQQPDGSTHTPPGDGAAFDGGPACGDSAGATNTWMSPRKSLPWELVGAASDGGTSNTLALDGGASSSGCTRPQTPSGIGDTICEGTAEVVDDGTTLRLEFRDGNALVWKPDRVPSPRVAPPLAANGDAVWVAYDHHVGLVCPFCGTYYDDELTIREGTGSGGRLLWVGMEGHTLEPPAPALLDELFGAGTAERLACRHVERAMCTDTTTEVFDEVIETRPEQAVHLNQLTHATTSRGDYDVVWAHTSQTDTPRPSCPPPQTGIDGPGPAWDMAFAVSRTR